MKPLLSIVVTSYTMDRFKDICDLFDSILNQSLVISPQSILNQVQDPLPYSQNIDSRLRTQDSGLSIIEVIFVAERSRELYEKVKEYGERIGLPNFV
ncbi:MAG: hypothetical protein COT13_04415 [Chloroflexi bacterium CG08_land_8_20_14_0_20_45_12]|nr:MAG: hypothetical protein COT13_04415 [Chloroflexi bacterium CG08_land_8_20_14_0_20_45_12]